MKKVRFMMMVAVAIFMGTTMVSCLNSDNESPWDFGDWMNVKDMMGMKYLESDNGYTFYITNPPTVLEQIKRGYLYVKLAEGDEYDPEQKEYRNATFYSYEVVSQVQSFNNRPDTISTSNKISELGDPWIGGGYINISNTFYYTSAADVKFDLCVVKAEDNILYTKLNFTQGGGDNAYSPGIIYHSFDIPRRIVLQDILNKVEGGEITPDSNDSIQVHISADGSNGDIQAKTFKIKLEQ